MVNNTKDLVNFLLNNYLKEINIAVDMTVGNGNDSKIILEFLKPDKLYCFDVQKRAIENSKNLIGIRENVHFILDTHANVDVYVKDRIDFAIYNLGYLPTGDKKITTLSKDVILSIEKLLKLLKEEGVIIITFYPGHENGKIEAEEISNHLSKLPQKDFSILKFEFLNQMNNPPFVIMVTRLKI